MYLNIQFWKLPRFLLERIFLEQMAMLVPQMVFLPLFLQLFRVQFCLFLRESRGQSGQCAQELSLSDNALKETLLPAPTFRHRTLRPRGVNCSRSVPAASWHVSGQQPRALVHVRTRRNRTWRRCPRRWEWRGRISPVTELVYQQSSSETTRRMEISPPTCCVAWGEEALIPWPVQSPTHY